MCLAGFPKGIFDAEPLNSRRSAPDYNPATFGSTSRANSRIDLSATEALTALKSVRVVDIDLGDGATKRSVTAGTNRAATVLRALGIGKIDPPNPPQAGQTVA